MLFNVSRVIKTFSICSIPLNVKMSPLFLAQARRPRRLRYTASLQHQWYVDHPSPTLSVSEYVNKTHKRFWFDVVQHCNRLLWNLLWIQCIRHYYLAIIITLVTCSSYLCNCHKVQWLHFRGMMNKVTIAYVIFSRF